MAAPTRTVKRLMLGRELAHMLATTKTTQAEVAALLETSQARVAGLLSGVGSIGVGDLEKLASHLGYTDPGHLAALRELRRDNHKRGFWTTGWRRAYGEDQRLLVQLEDMADQIRGAGCEIMHGLIQCESYVRAVHGGDEPSELDDMGVSLEDRITARLARQSILDKPNPPTIHFVLSESCLRRAWGDDEVMREQLNHVITLSTREHMMIQVMPFRSRPGRRSPMGNQFTMIRVPSPGVSGPLEVVSREGEAGELRMADATPVLRQHEQGWARLSTAALSLEESCEFIREIEQEYH